MRSLVPGIFLLLLLLQGVCMVAQAPQATATVLLEQQLREARFLLGLENGKFVGAGVPVLETALAEARYVLSERITSLVRSHSSSPQCATSWRRMGSWPWRWKPDLRSLALCRRRSVSLIGSPGWQHSGINILTA